ncbi:glycoside hydrolase family 2 [Mucilaginibacter corticis]|uniref:Glycoside hydrolase family 2 n=1 Tax=Mucilaginibacter corticis TaxID=2597670 RepID=A0A556M9K6_9SPHI|nr:sugar-binding domain-containing protein [Mucilaginibacter corticis]TSJ36597.1 glycoside hydrolase family 2 [Mucilaginibacter corticis]
MKTRLYTLIAVYLLIVGKTIAQHSYKMQPAVLQTRWAKEVTALHNHDAYPRPQLMRTNWINLNGLWDYAIVHKGEQPKENFGGRILVPYPIESALSGVQKSLLPDQELWYKRKVLKPKSKTGDRVLLHFGAVDWQATVFVNGKEVVKHEGGYTAFTVDITSELKAGSNELKVKVFDPTDAGIQPHGKQTLNPANIYYTPSSGIWQTVWMEVVQKNYIESLTITPDIDKKLVSVIVHSHVNGTVKLKTDNCIIAGKANTVINVPVKDMKLWSPENPHLYDLTVILGKDQVKSYFGMRKIGVAKDIKGISRICLNNKPYYNLGTLDQGFWPDGLYSAPTDAALKFDVEAIKAMGFNTIRKHIKVEPARWYYYADKLGILVWQDMVNPDQQLRPGAKVEFEKESKEIVNQLHNYPSITTWVLFNEEWGAYDQARMTNWLKISDPTRLVNGHSGGILYVNNQKAKGADTSYVNADITDIHSYPNPMISLNQNNKAMVCGEFGGIGVSVTGHEWNDITGWGYVQVLPKDLESRYDHMIKKLYQLKEQGLSGSIYTQPFDVEGEENGLITYDREIAKVPLTRLKEINSQLIRTAPYHLSTTIGNTNNIQTDVQYQTLLDKFNQNPNQDSTFLRGLTIMALHKKDQENLTKIGNAYIDKLKYPDIDQNAVFISQITRTSKDKGFQLFSKSDNPQRQNFAVNILMSEILSKLDNETNLAILDTVAQKVTEKYGKIGERASAHAIAGFAWNKQNWPLFVKYKNIIYKKFDADVNGLNINNDSWTIFLKSVDKFELESALNWQKIVLGREQYKDGGSIDTYANILYKLGRKEEAIEWENKAIATSEDPELKKTLEKMKAGQPTW